MERPGVLQGRRIQPGPPGAGGQKSRVILLVRTEPGVNSLLRSTGKLGAQGSIAVGPVGAAATVTADILTIVKAKGAFTGVSLEGTAIEAYTEFNHAYFGKAVTPRDILIDRAVTNPASDGLKKTLLDAAR